MQFISQRSLMLILNVCLLISAKWKRLGSSRKFLYYCHLFTWPYGILVTLTASGYPWLPIAELRPALSTCGCRGNFRHEMNQDKTECLIVGLGKMLWTIYYFNLVLLMIITMILFAISLFLARKNWIQTSRKSRKKSLELSKWTISEEGYSVQADFSLGILKRTLRLSITAFIYILSILPLIFLRLYNIYFGLFRYTFFRKFLLIYPSISSVTIGVLNVVSYVYLSSAFRQKIVENFVRPKTNDRKSTLCQSEKTNLENSSSMSFHDSAPSSSAGGSNEELSQSDGYGTFKRK